MTSVSDPLSRTSRQENVKKYYGDVLNTSDDLATDACATIEETPPHLARAFKNIHPEVSARYYGCGLVAPSGLLGAKVLDLGCGAGRDVYALAQLVGPSGHVTGVDMTPEQLEVARRHQDWHKQRFGFNETNVTFMDGDIERLDALELGEGVFDVIVSNCVINLCSDKNAVFSNAFRLLKPGGEMYFADVYADRRLPPEARND
ncbi:MAG: methyltransferase domain-containing protein, partial [Pseudomonadota bacterium]